MSVSLNKGAISVEVAISLKEAEEEEVGLP